jgi:hypothetical protein
LSGSSHTPLGSIINNFDSLYNYQILGYTIKCEEEDNMYENLEKQIFILTISVYLAGYYI